MQSRYDLARRWYALKARLLGVDHDGLAAVQDYGAVPWMAPRTERISLLDGGLQSSVVLARLLEAAPGARVYEPNDWKAPYASGRNSSAAR